VPERYPGGAGRETSGAAVWSLVLGMVALVTPVFGMFVGIGAIVAAASARSNINNASGRIGGEGIATAGFVMGIVAIIGHVALCGRIF